MKAKFLFPFYFRLLGWLVVIPGFVLGYLNVFQSYEIEGFGLKLREKSSIIVPAFENFTNELALVLVIAGLLFIAFARLRREDELTASLRLNALYWAILINYVLYGVLLLLVLFNNVTKTDEQDGVLDWLVGNLKFMIYNLFMPLVVFIARFYYLLYKSNNEYQMKPLRFLPHRPYNLIGKILTIPLIILALPILLNYLGFFDKQSDVLGMIFYLLPFIMLIWVYSKEKHEDEYINHIRLEAMQIAVYSNYVILLLSTLFLFSLSFLLMLFFNLVTIPLIFIVVFKYRIWKLNRRDSKIRSNDLTLGIL